MCASANNECAATVSDFRDILLDAKSKDMLLRGKDPALVSVCTKTVREYEQLVGGQLLGGDADLHVDTRAPKGHMHVYRTMCDRARRGPKPGRLRIPWPSTFSPVFPDSLTGGAINGKQSTKAGKWCAITFQAVLPSKPLSGSANASWICNAADPRTLSSSTTPRASTRYPSKSSYRAVQTPQGSAMPDKLL